MYYLTAIILALGLCISQLLIGGVKLLFGFPAYVVIAVAAILTLSLSIYRPFQNRLRLCLCITVALTAYVVTRSLLSPVEYLARNDFFMVLAAFVVYLLASLFLTRTRHRLFVLKILFALALLHTFIGIIQFVWDDNFMLFSLLPDTFVFPKFFRPDYGWRASGFYICPNHLAGLLETLLLIAIGLFCFAEKQVRGRITILYISVIFILGIALTGSRGGYLSTLTGVGILLTMVVWSVKKLRPNSVLLTISLSGCITAALIGGVIWTMSQSTVLDERMGQVVDTGNMRPLMWGAALKQYSLSPVFGTGSGTYLYYGRHFRDPSVQNDPIHVHNDYLELLGEYGLLGCGLMAVFLFLHINSGRRALSIVVNRYLKPTGRTNSDELGILVGVLAATFALLIHSILDFNFHIPGNTLLFAFLFGILANPIPETEVFASEAIAPKRISRFLLPAFGVVILGLIFPLIKGEYYAEWARIHLRNMIYVDSIKATNSAIALSAPSTGLGHAFPASGFEATWADGYLKKHILSLAQSYAERGFQNEQKNPDIYYYLGEVHHFLAVYENEPTKRLLEHAAAADAYSKGLILFPHDVRLQLKLGRAYDNQGLYEQAGDVLMQAIRFDPNLGNTYASFGYHLWLLRKIYRAEGYYYKALKLDPSNALAIAGLADIQRLRALSKDPSYVDKAGDPLEAVDSEELTEVDIQLGVQEVVIHE